MRQSDCELHSKDFPAAYDECCLCEDYESALSYIDLFYGEYADVGVKEPDKARYAIVKRQRFSCDGQCSECNKTCPRRPVMIKKA